MTSCPGSFLLISGHRGLRESLLQSDDQGCIDPRLYTGHGGILHLRGTNVLHRNPALQKLNLCAAAFGVSFRS